MRRTREALLFTAVALLVASCGEAPNDEPLAVTRKPVVASGPPYALDLSGSEWALWIDARAAWEEDELFLPGVDVATLAVREPTGGWRALESGGETLAVSVPGTVEQFLWGALADTRRDLAGPQPVQPTLDGDFKGVSWWCRSFDLPAAWLEPTALGPPVVELHFDAVRVRAEVFVNEQLVGYDAVGNTPFRVDVSGAVHPGRNTLAVRVTDPGGNFSWEDFDALTWGRHTIPASHGFGGVTGPVRLEVHAPLYISDVYVDSRGEIALPNLSVRNATSDTLRALFHVELFPVSGESASDVAVADSWDTARDYPPGNLNYLFSPKLILPVDVQWWAPETPNLYRLRVSLHLASEAQPTTAAPGAPSPAVAPVGAGIAVPSSPSRVDPAVDVHEVRFGYRRLYVDGVDASKPGAQDNDAVLRLNGKRIVLRSAISWGFWPTSGMVPTPELARKQVEDAKALGLNTLNHHRTIAAPGLLDVQDELGLLAYCEPGGYAAHGGDEFCRALARAKWMRMIERDRNHPSVVIWNMINEETTPPTEAQRQDLRDAFEQLDPSRLMTFTSAWSKEGDDPLKLHMRPVYPDHQLLDGVPVFTTGWSDNHNAPGPGVWRDEFWKSPAEYLRRSENRGEIVFWGEEGAIAAPPRLAAIVPRIDRNEPGWDGADYLAWAAAFQRFLDDKGFTADGIGLDAFTTGLGAVAYDYQARAIENVRLGDVADGYVINGWEDSKLENHSGIVDVWRNLKADPAPLARANAPVALVVRLRSSIGNASEWLSPSVQTPTGTVADIGLINEINLSGPHTLALAVRDATGRVMWERSLEVQVQGGDVYGQMLAEAMTATFQGDAGSYVYSAELRAGAKAEAAAPVVASGRDELLLVDWRSRALPANIALLETGRSLRRFFEENGKGRPEDFRTDLPPLDVLVAGDWDPEPRETIPATALSLTGRFYKGATLPPPDVGAAPGGVPGIAAPDATAEGGVLDFEWSRQEPAPDIGTSDWIARWEGTLTAPESGPYLLHTLSDDGVRLWLDGALLIDHWDTHGPEYDRVGPIELVAGESHALRVEYWQTDKAATLKLQWTTPARLAETATTVDECVRRARQDGTTILALWRADVWARLLAERGLVQYDGRLDQGRYWLGGGFVARPHPILNGLPSGGALGRPYQELVQYGAQRYGLYLSGEECVIGCVSDHKFRPATALGVITAGRGRIVLSTLDILRTLNGPPGPRDVVRKLFTNLVSWGAERPQ